MSCPFPDCRSPEANIEVRYGAREIGCPTCGKFKMTDKLFESAAVVFSAQQESTDDLRGFIQARNQEGKIPMLNDETWRMLASEHKNAATS